MEWREALDEAQSEEAIDELSQGLDASRREHLQQIEKLLDHSRDPAAAAQQVRALMFIERFGEDIEARAAQLGQ
jgi:molecular chaperone HscB